METMPLDPYRLRLKFWGVRGSTPTPGAEYLQFGGNTTCFEILDGEEPAYLRCRQRHSKTRPSPGRAEFRPHDLHLFLTHFHWDHIQGLPFFAPLLRAGNKLTFHSFPGAEEIKARLQRQMSSPYFTLGFEHVGAMREFCRPTTPFVMATWRVTAFPLHHPQGACGYRIESDGAVVVIATDLEHGDPALDKVLREYSEGADVLIYDAQYTPSEYETRHGWGHSTYHAAAAVAHDAGVQRLVLFHHDPTHDDMQMNQIATSAIAEFENTGVAREMDCITL